LGSFLSTLNGYENIFTSSDVAYSHLTQQEKQPLLDQISSHKKNINTLVSQIPNLKKDEDVKPSLQEINAEHEKFINAAKVVANKPKPTPPKEEPKKAETPKPEEPQTAEQTSAGTEKKS